MSTEVYFSITKTHPDGNPRKIVYEIEISNDVFLSSTFDADLSELLDKHTRGQIYVRLDDGRMGVYKGQWKIHENTQYWEIWLVNEDKSPLIHTGLKVPIVVWHPSDKLTKIIQ